MRPLWVQGEARRKNQRHPAVTPPGPWRVLDCAYFWWAESVASCVFARNASNSARTKSGRSPKTNARKLRSPP
jgi:hypothetical protein